VLTDRISVGVAATRAAFPKYFQWCCCPTGRGPQDKGFRPGGRRSFDSWQVGVSIDSSLQYGRLFLLFLLFCYF